MHQQLAQEEPEVPSLMDNREWEEMYLFKAQHSHRMAMEVAEPLQLTTKAL